MSDPTPIYKKRIADFEVDLKAAKRQLLYSSMLRLIIFILTCFGVYLLWGSLQAIIFCILTFFVLFFVLVNRHVNIQNNRDRLKTLISINKTEIDVINRKFSHLPDGSEFIDPLHPYSQDIDLFGKRSFFQYLNRTALKEGKQRLAHFLTENNTKGIDKRQEAIQDLRPKLDFRQSFSASARLTINEEEDDIPPILQLLNTLKKHDPFTPKRAVLLSSIFSGLSLLFILLFLTDFIPVSLLIIWLFIGVGITGIYAKRVGDLSDKVDQLQKVFQHYHKLIKLLEEESFSSELLQQYQNEIRTDSKKASDILKQFSKTIDALDQRENLLFGFLGNGFLLWDLRQSSKLEKWITQYITLTERWFAILADIDAYNSLGNFTFNHPDYTFPKITDNKTIIEVEKAVHPLIPKDEAITNDIKIDKGEFFIITGANMAGKSTFLRTISLQIVMSNVGLPVCAESCNYTPTKLITSMRTVDSLAEEASYFYAELSRLKFIIDQLQKEDYFIVLDEILKGTNSKDKAIGSQKFLEKLVAQHSTGIIATHDLSLCQVADHIKSVKNYYFDALIENDELSFDYKFKKGICQNMNASFLLKKMKIID